MRKVRLVKLAQEQGYLTYNDINDAPPDNMVSPEDLDEIYSKLRSLEVEIVDQAEVVRQTWSQKRGWQGWLDILTIRFDGSKWAGAFANP